MVTTLVERLSAARRASFVGRERELAAFRDVMASGSGGVIYVHGPGGMGKTSLLRQFAWVAQEEGRPATWLDRDDVLPDAGQWPPADIADSPPAAPGVVLIDSIDGLVAGEAWIRDQLVPGLPDGTVVVVAARRPPSAQWRADPGWKTMLTVLRLSNLSDEESRALLHRLALPDIDHELAVTVTHGHPLALALVADVAAQEPHHVSPINRPGVVTALLEQLVDTVPSAEHRSALEACAQVRVTTEPLLAALLDVPDAAALFGWLRDLTLMDYGPRGIAPHELARDVLAAEVRWRHPDWYAEMHRRAGRYYHSQFSRADEHLQRVLLFDLLYLHRHSPVLESFLRAELHHADEVDALTIARARQDDGPVLHEMVRAHEGDDSARIAEYWFARRPEATAVVRNGRDEIMGFCSVLRIESATDEERTADPAVAAACAHLAATTPPVGPGEVAVLVRHWMDRDAHQLLSPAQTAITLHLVRMYLTTPHLAYSLLPCADPEFWAIPCAYADLARIEEADFTVGTVTHGMFGHDWRTVPPIRWLSLLAERETALSPVLTPAPEEGRAQPSPAPLEEGRFRDAVRGALRELGRADRLARCALIETRLVARRAGADAPRDGRRRALQAAVGDAMRAMEAAPRDRRGQRALHHMYIQPAGTQELAAEVLGLPMSTFRRHLATGTARLTEILWEEESAAD